MGDLNKKGNSLIDTDNNLKSYGSSKDELALILSNGQNPYPNHEGYTALREKYGRNPSYKSFFLSVICNKNGDITINRKLFRNNEHKNHLFCVKSNRYDGIYDGSFEPTIGGKGLEGVSYICPEQVKRQLSINGKNIFENREQINDFLGLLPGETEKEKLQSMIILLNFPKSGYMFVPSGDIPEEFDPTFDLCEVWNYVGEHGYIGLSVDTHTNEYYSLCFGDNINPYIDTEDIDGGFPQPFLAFEELPE